MDIKKKCINFKKNAEKLGYKLKLTHVQELIAKYEGFENRHALFNSSQTKEKKESKKKDWFYYEVHVFFGRDEGYSVTFRTKEKMEVSNGILDEDRIIEKVEELDLLQEDGDYKNIDRVSEIEKDDWIFFSNYNENQIECQSCRQFYDQDFITNRGYSICKNCEKNKNEND